MIGNVHEAWSPLDCRISSAQRAALEASILVGIGGPNTAINPSPKKFMDDA
jgi:hypothetical protein